MPVHDWNRVGAGIFHDFHHAWIEEIKRALNSGLLPPDFYALAEQVAGGLGPDVLTLQADGPNGSRPRVPPQGAVAVAVCPPKARFTASTETDRYAEKAKRVVIRHSSGDHVVAMAEVVSPVNKGSRHGIRSFVEKAAEVLRAGVHLLIVDLFPPGPRDPQGVHKAIWDEIAETDFAQPPDKPLTLAAYAAGPAKTYYVEPVAVGDALPDMPLFLDPDYYVRIPLEATSRSAFAAVPGRWQRVLDAPAAS